MTATELKKLAEAATPGPWAHEEIDPTDPEWGACEVFTEESDDFVATHVCSKANAAFIAAANPAAIIELLEVTKGLAEALHCFHRDYIAVHDIGDVEMQPAIYQARTAIAKYEGVQSALTKDQS